MKTSTAAFTSKRCIVLYFEWMSKKPMFVSDRVKNYVKNSDKWNSSTRPRAIKNELEMVGGETTSRVSFPNGASE